MNRLEEELELVRGAWPAAEYERHGEIDWVRIQEFPLPAGIYRQGEQLEVLAFRVPHQAGEAPYAFFVYPGLELASGGTLGNYTWPVGTPWGDDWGQFSWSPLEPWVPKAEIRAGANMLDFVRSFTVRLGEGS